ncbi:MAG: glycosyltransferase [Chitinivibrionales bacterium]|nr:glycosyltransferase [Chitinivibrionales bacterium]
MNILFVSNEYPPETGFGGIGTYTQCMAEALADRGHNVHVICRSASGVPARKKCSNVTIHRISPGTYPLPQGKAFYPFRMLCYRYIPDSLIRLAWANEVYKTFMQLSESDCRFDIVEFPECNGEGFYITRNNVSGTIVRLHTPWELARKLDRIVSRPLDRIVSAFIEKHSAKHARGICSPTHSLANKLSKEWKLKNIRVYPNPITVHSFENTDGTGIIYTGRIEHRKGVHTLINAYGSLCNEINDAPQLRLIGRPYGVLPDGFDYGVLIENQINSHNLRERVAWVKGTDATGVKQHLAASSIAVFPSIWENFPYTCLEAMASGLAVIASRCGGYKEIIEDEKNGLLFEPGNAEDLRKKLQILCNNDHIRQKLGTQARNRISELCNPDNICTEAEKLYRHTAESTINEQR